MFNLFQRGPAGPTPDELRDAVSDDRIAFLDVRTPAEWAEGHVDGAHHLDVMNPGFDAGLASLDKSKTYFVYCRSGNRSGQAASQMQAQGFTARNAGGIGALAAAGLPVVR